VRLFWYGIGISIKLHVYSITSRTLKRSQNCETRMCLTRQQNCSSQRPNTSLVHSQYVATHWLITITAVQTSSCMRGDNFSSNCTTCYSKSDTTHLQCRLGTSAWCVQIEATVQVCHLCHLRDSFGTTAGHANQKRDSRHSVINGNCCNTLQTKV
jgi:hypothetical protein